MGNPADCCPLKVSASGETWTVLKRYSSLYAMVTLVKKRLGTAANSIGVTFPPKVLGTVNVEERRLALEWFLKSFFRESRVSQLPEVPAPLTPCCSKECAQRKRCGPQGDTGDPAAPATDPAQYALNLAPSRHSSCLPPPHPHRFRCRHSCAPRTRNPSVPRLAHQCNCRSPPAPSPPSPAAPPAPKVAAPVTVSVTASVAASAVGLAAAAAVVAGWGRDYSKDTGWGR